MSNIIVMGNFYSAQALMDTEMGLFKPRPGSYQHHSPLETISTESMD